MILKLYRKLSDIADKYLIVASSKIIYLPSGEPQKLRLFIIDGTILDVWLTHLGKYSYHWDRHNIHKGVYRFDNAPHKKWRKIKTYPDHLHFGSESEVRESKLAKDPEKALIYVLDFIQEILRNDSEAE